jgi:hypothetical protein
LAGNQFGGRGKKGESMTKPQLLELAKRLGIRGRSEMVGIYAST